MTKHKKIVIIGMQNAGKTSIIKTIKREFEEITTLRATNRINYESLDFLGRVFQFWDFGGQDKYRNMYLENPEQYFLNISNVFYVFDVQDTELKPLSIKYFTDIIINLKKLSPEAKIILINHKFDPQLEEESLMGARKNIQDFLHETRDILKNMDFKIQIFRTSIFDTFSIINAISQPLLSKDDLMDEISEILNKFSKKNDLEFAVLFSDKFLEIGYYKNDTLMVKEFDEIIKNYFKELGISPISLDPSYFLKHMKINILNYPIEFNLGIEQVRLFIVVGYSKKKEQEKGNKNLEENLNKLGRNLRKLLENTDLTEFL